MSGAASEERGRALPVMAWWGIGGRKDSARRGHQIIRHQLAQDGQDVVSQVGGAARHPAWQQTGLVTRWMDGWMDGWLVG